MILDYVFANMIPNALMLTAVSIFYLALRNESVLKFIKTNDDSIKQFVYNVLSIVYLLTVVIFIFYQFTLIDKFEKYYGLAKYYNVSVNHIQSLDKKHLDYLKDNMTRNIILNLNKEKR